MSIKLCSPISTQLTLHTIFSHKNSSHNLISKPSPINFTPNIYCWMHTITSLLRPTTTIIPKITMNNQNPTKPTTTMDPPPITTTPITPKITINNKIPTKPTTTMDPQPPTTTRIIPKITMNNKIPTKPTTPIIPKSTMNNQNPTKPTTTINPKSNMNNKTPTKPTTTMDPQPAAPPTTPNPLSSSRKRPRTKDPLPYNTWAPLNLPKSELSLPLTFPTGQTFRWKKTGPHEYTGVINSHLISLKHSDSESGHVYYLVHKPNVAIESGVATDVLSELSDFLNLGVSLSDLWRHFSAVDTRFAELAPHLQGARVLRQHPLECLMQFLCSTNNNIGRITKMVDFLSSLGTVVGSVGGFEFRVFPTLDRLSKVTEQELRDAGFGYRAKYIVDAVKTLGKKPGGGVEWLLSLREKGRDEAIHALSGLAGVGGKVAACVALFSLDKHDAVPVDTHVGRIATTYLFPELTGVRMSPSLCSRVADAFVKRYGEYAGWAQTLLFVAELPSQKALIPSEVQSVKEKKARKLSKKQKKKVESSSDEEEELEWSSGSSEEKEKKVKKSSKKQKVVSSSDELEWFASSSDGKDAE